MSQNTPLPVLSVQKLSVGFETTDGLLPVTDEISLELYPGELVGLVGESGSGKSVTALAVMGLLGQGASVLSGSIRFLGRELTGLSEAEYRKLRGEGMAMVFQEPMTSLNPVLTVGVQAEEMLLLHGKGGSRTERKKRVLAMFEETGLKNGAALYEAYPHQLSGGMRQRVMLAMAMLCRPKLLIADEPTTALDVTLQAKILEMIQKLNRDYGTAVLFISHDLNVIRKLCNRALVLYRGSCVEQGATENLFFRPQQDYTRQLLQASFGRDFTASRSRIERKELLLRVRELSVAYTKKQEKKAVDGVSFELYRGETLGIVGESGSGKSSLAKALAGLQSYHAAEVSYHGLQERLKPRMVFQDPYGSLNPAKTLGWLLEEPLRMMKGSRRFSKKERDQRRAQAEEMLSRTGLPVEFYSRFPRALSGGQRQRAAIAAALMTKPEFLILDEPVSALDVTIQEQVLELLAQLREEFGLTYLFISHDMSVVRRFCDRICVMYEGKIVESAKTEQLFAEPKNNYTKRLLASILS